jgi:hypothetical protein
VPFIERRVELRVVRSPITVDARAHFRARKLARIHGRTAARQPPDEADALLRLARRRDRFGPRIGHKVGIDIGQAPIGIDVRARKPCLDQRGAVRRCGAPQPRDVRILGLADHVSRRRMVEIVRIPFAGMRRVEHQRDRCAARIVAFEYFVHQDCIMAY